MTLANSSLSSLLVLSTTKKTLNSFTRLSPTNTIVVIACLGVSSGVAYFISTRLTSKSKYSEYIVIFAGVMFKRLRDGTILMVLIYFVSCVWRMHKIDGLSNKIQIDKGGTALQIQRAPAQSPRITIQDGCELRGTPESVELVNLLPGKIDIGHLESDKPIGIRASLHLVDFVCNASTRTHAQHYWKNLLRSAYEMQLELDSNFKLKQASLRSYAVARIDLNHMPFATISGSNGSLPDRLADFRARVNQELSRARERFITSRHNRLRPSVNRPEENQAIELYNEPIRLPIDPLQQAERRGQIEIRSSTHRLTLHRPGRPRPEQDTTYTRFTISTPWGVLGTIDSRDLPNHGGVQLMLSNAVQLGLISPEDGENSRVFMNINNLGFVLDRSNELATSKKAKQATSKQTQRANMFAIEGKLTPLQRCYITSRKGHKQDVDFWTKIEEAAAQHRGAAATTRKYASWIFGTPIAGFRGAEGLQVLLNNIRKTGTQMKKAAQSQKAGAGTSIAKQGIKLSSKSRPSTSVLANTAKYGPAYSLWEGWDALWNSLGVIPVVLEEMQDMGYYITRKLDTKPFLKTENTLLALEQRYGADVARHSGATRSFNQEAIEELLEQRLSSTKEEKVIEKNKQKSIKGKEKVEEFKRETQIDEMNLRLMLDEFGNQDEAESSTSRHRKISRRNQKKPKDW